MTPILGFGLPGGPELWIILAIFLLLFGHRIPGMARSMGSGIVEFKKGLKGDPDKDDPEKTLSDGPISDGEKQPQDSGPTNV